MANRVICPVCNRKVSEDMYKIKCCLCSDTFHKKCTMLNEQEFNEMTSPQKQVWSCRICNETLFAFNQIDDDFTFQRCLFDLNLLSRNLDITHVQNLIMDPFDLNEDYDNIPLSDLDPDLQFYNDIQHTLYNNNSDYFDELSFNKMIAKNFNGKNTFALFHLNIRSLPAKLTNMLCYFENVNIEFDVIGISESWLTSENKDLYFIQDYEHLSNTRTDKSGGGVSLFVASHIRYKELTEFHISNENIECIFIEATIDSKQVIVGVIYRPPNSNVVEFTSLLNIILEKLKISNKPCWIMGDYNIDLMKNDSHKPTTDFVNMMFSNALIPLINKPTRITSHSATIIDNIFSNKLHNDGILVQGNLTTDLSDHFAQFHIIEQSPKNKPNTEYMFIRVKNQTNIEKYSNSINSFNWSDIEQYTDCNQAYQYLSKSLEKIFNESFPVQRVKKRYRNRLPWLTDGLRKSIKQKNKLYKKYVKFQTSYNKKTYNIYNNKLKAILKKSEKEYYHHSLAKCTNNLKKTWSIIKEVLNRNKSSKINDTFTYNNQTTSDKNIIANKFNDYFVNIGSTLAASIPKEGPNFKTYLPQTNEDTIYLTPTNADEITKIINRLKNSAPGHDEIILNDIKPFLNILIQPLTYVTNLSLMQGVFPDELKKAKIIPLYKANDPMLFNNYRPISILPLFSKVLERIMYNRIVKFINKHKLLYKYQFGFRKDHSTYMALIILIDKITAALDNGDFTITVLIDFRKAFDTVDHSILLNKLYHYGIRGIAFEWMKSYLSNRQQQVSYNGANSSYKTMNCGVPQGSILGPLLFIIYINDLSTVSNILTSVLFADDTTLVDSDRNLTTLINRFNTELVNIVHWLNANRLSLNIEKTNFMIFRPKNKDEAGPNLTINGSQIAQVKKAKFLGVIIDDKLNWSDHTKYVTKKISKGIGIIIKARRYFNQKTLINLYNTMVLPFMSYCIQIWGKAASTHLGKILILQKKIVRIISGVPPRTHTQPLFDELKLMTIYQTYDYYVGVFMYKLYHEQLPPLFTMFNRTPAIHHYSTRQYSGFYISYAPTVRTQRTVKITGCKLWNAVIRKIDVNSKIGSYKTNLKKIIFSNLD